MRYDAVGVVRAWAGVEGSCRSRQGRAGEDRAARGGAYLQCIVFDGRHIYNFPGT